MRSCPSHEQASNQRRSIAVPAKLRVYVPLRSDVRHSGQNLTDDGDNSDSKLASAVDSVIQFVKEQSAMNHSKDELSTFLTS